jgi:hypothetical protein
MLQALLKRGRIFQTIRGQRLYEERARQNVAREIAELTMTRARLSVTIARPRPKAIKRHDRAHS